MQEILLYAAKIISLCSVIIIIYGIILAVIDFISIEFKPDTNKGIRTIRVKFGSYLLLGLELLISADIIRTIIEPGYDELIILAGVVIIRTLMSVFLNREVKELEAEKE